MGMCDMCGKQKKIKEEFKTDYYVIAVCEDCLDGADIFQRRKTR